MSLWRKALNPPRWLRGVIDQRTGEERVETALEEYFLAALQFRIVHRNGVVVVYDAAPDTADSLRFVVATCKLAVDIKHFTTREELQAFLATPAPVRCIVIDAGVPRLHQTLKELRESRRQLPFFIKGCSREQRFELAQDQGFASFPHGVSAATMCIRAGLLPERVC